MRPILSEPDGRPRRHSLRRIVPRALRLAVRVAVALLLLCLAAVLLYRWVGPPVTPLMLLRLPEEGRIDRQPMPLDAIARELQRAVIASEDNRFCQHHGVDWNAVSDAMSEYEVEGRLRGASTITMQTARNLFLWPGGGFFRKGIEVALAYVIDALWPKRRIMEVYLNVIEWGDGIYGAEAAARAYFHKSAARLSRHEAALMVAVLPNPRRWSPEHPTPYIAERAAIIGGRLDKLEGYFGCLR
ncbi:MAG: monofunctional biosynthetic peptidoglycan transglycosylase [Alphaproteobacteria bacterium]